MFLKFYKNEISEARHYIGNHQINIHKAILAEKIIVQYQDWLVTTFHTGTEEAIDNNTSNLFPIVTKFDREIAKKAWVGGSGLYWSSKLVPL